MNTLLIILQQTRTGAILEIVVLLVVAALIGYITAYFYYKSIYTKIINTLEEEKSVLNKQIDTLRSEKAKLESTIKEKDAEIEALKSPKN